MSEHAEHAKQSLDAPDSLEEPIQRYVRDVLAHLPPAGWALAVVLWVVPAGITFLTGSMFPLPF